MFKPLMEYFTIIGVDHIGMGASSRIEGHYNMSSTPEECNDYFVDHMEKWRVAF